MYIVKSSCIVQENDNIMKTFVLGVKENSAFVLVYMFKYMYTCRGIYLLLHVYMVVMYVLFPLHSTPSLYVCIIIRLNITDIYSHCNRYRWYGDDTIIPCLKNVIRTFVQGFVFIR